MENFDSRFQVVLHQMGERCKGIIVAHRQVFVVGFGLGCLGLLGLCGWFYWQHQREEGAARAGFEVHKEREVYVAAPSPEKRSQLVEKYKKALAEFGTTREGRFLHLEFAHFQSREGFCADAMTSFAAFRKGFALASPYRSIGTLGLARCLAADEKWEEAHRHLVEIYNLKDDPQREFAVFELGKVEEKRGKRDEAVKYYRELLLDFPQSPLADLVQDRLSGLGAENT